MGKVVFDESLILKFDRSMTNTEVLSEMTDYLCSQGIVKDTYKKAILDRELSFPTGLNTRGINVAIPHADICHVNKASICVAVLKEPVLFRAMDEPDSEIPVSLVIMLALTEAHGHIEMLQKIVKLIQNQQTMKEIVETDDMRRVNQIVCEHLLEN